MCLTPQATQVLWKRRGANALRIARRKIQSMVEPREAIRANTGLRIAEFSIVYDDIQRGFAECFVEFGRSGGWCSFPWIHRTKASSDYERVQQQLQAGPLPTPHTVYLHSLALWDKRRPGVPPARVRPLQEADGADLEPQPLQIVSLASMPFPGPR